MGVQRQISRPPGATRPAPGVGGGLRGVAPPPEICRRVQGAMRGPPAAAHAVDRIQCTLRQAQQKLLDSQAKLLGSVASLRGQLGSRS